MKRPAKGTRGCLLYDFADNSTIFRVYDENHNFKDYKICHFDLEIEIIDDMAFFLDGITEDGYDGSINDEI